MVAVTPRAMDIIAVLRSTLTIASLGGEKKPSQHLTNSSVAHPSMPARTSPEMGRPEGETW